ncbi:hypothetical protein M9H77_34975 [Catharanthus roseus]|uniref:Uncharacterized protein n=1 Tax=Catharanthus roseus TaxID=4058 RepID=A0ACB9ZRC0_CATRO|nr:hypothetical protein M9H77_34975 [Catharanthus roseus]
MVKVKNANIGRGENFEEGESSRCGKTGKGKGKNAASEVRLPERLLHHMISNIIIPNMGHNSSMTNMHSFVMLALHEYRRMNFGFMAIEHMLSTQTSSTKCLPYGHFLTKVFQYFVLNLVGVGDHIGIGKSITYILSKEWDFQEMRKMHKKSLNDNLQKSKRSLKITMLYEDEVIKLKTLNTRRIIRNSFIRYLCKVTTRGSLQNSAIEDILDDPE